MTAANIYLDDRTLPAAAQYGTGWWLDLHGADSAQSIAVQTVEQAKALNAAAQKILREMRTEAKAQAALARQALNGTAPVAGPADPWADDPAERVPVPEAPEPYTAPQVRAEPPASLADALKASLASIPAQDANGQASSLAEAPVGVCVFCGHGGPLKDHGTGDMVCTDDAACLARGWKDTPGVATAGQPPADFESTGGRAPLAGYQTVPTFTCGDCGGHGTMPSHRPDCWRHGVANLREHKTTGRARQTLLAFIDEGVPETEQTDCERGLAQDLRALLALIDAQAGAV